MSYPEFRESFFEVLQERVPDNIHLDIISVEKTNGILRYGISFTKEDGVFAPTIYLEPFYEKFQKGICIDELVEEIYGYYTEETIEVPDCIKLLDQFDSAKPLIYIKMLHAEENVNLLADTPHIKFLDFAVIAYFEVEGDKLFKGSVIIKKHHIQMWGITENELLEWAAANTKSNKIACFSKMSELLESYIASEDRERLNETGEDMYVLTNMDKYFGAVLIYFDSVIETIYECVEEDFYLLPASVHEWVILPASQVRDTKELFSMVRDINDYEVIREEVLSYNVYLYDSRSQKINILDDISKEN